MAPLIQLSAVTLIRDGQTLVGPIDWTLNEDERWVVLGENGSGKSSLIAIASLVLHPSSGSVSVLGKKLGTADIRPLRAQIGQATPNLADRLRPHLTAIEIVQCGLYGALEPWWHQYRDSDRRRAERLLSDVGLERHGKRRFSTLSSGERQRTLLARSLMSNPAILLLDEPTAGLDLAGRESLLSALDEIATQQSPSWVVVTHRVEDIPSSTSHCLFFSQDGTYLSGPISEVLDEANLERTFGLEVKLSYDSGRWFASAASRKYNSTR